MYQKTCVVLIVASLFSEIICLRNSRNVEQCIDYYSAGEDFDLKALSGEMYAVYYWPPNQRQRDSCELVSFKQLSSSEISQANNECNSLSVPLDDKVMRATYNNSAGKLVSVLYYGREEVKLLYRSCDRALSKYIFRKVNEDYVLGINCSSGGRGVLLSRTLPSMSTVQSVVNTIDIMTGREVENECGEIPTVIVQNKIDLMDQCVVGPDEAELVARALGCRLMRASVKEDVNVGAVFRALATRCLQDMRSEDAADSLPPCVTPVIGTFTNHGSNGTILLRPAKHRAGGKKKNVLRNACRIL